MNSIKSAAQPPIEWPMQAYASIGWSRNTNRNFRCYDASNINSITFQLWAGIAQSVLRLATGWTVRGSNPGGDEIFRTLPDRPWGPPSLLYNGYRVFPGDKAAGAWRWPPTHILRRGWRKSRAIHLLSLWVFVACSRVNFILFYFTITFQFTNEEEKLESLFRYWNRMHTTKFRDF